MSKKVYSIYYSGWLLTPLPPRKMPSVISALPAFLRRPRRLASRLDRPSALVARRCAGRGGTRGCKRAAGRDGALDARAGPRAFHGGVRGACAGCRLRSGRRRRETERRRRGRRRRLQPPERHVQLDVDGEACAGSFFAFVDCHHVVACPSLESIGGERPKRELRGE